MELLTVNPLGPPKPQLGDTVGITSNLMTLYHMVSYCIPYSVMDGFTVVDRDGLQSMMSHGLP